MFNSFLKEWVYLGSFLTQYAKDKIMAALKGDIPLGDYFTLFGDMVAEMQHPTLGTITQSFAPVAGPTRRKNEVLTTYNLVETDFQNAISAFTASTPISSESSSVEETLRIPVNIDKSTSNPLGQFALSITRRDRVI